MIPTTVMRNLATKAQRFAHVFGNRADSFDGHDRDGVTSVVEGQIILSGVGSLDCNPFSGLHRAHLRLNLFVVFKAMPPDSFINELIGYIGPCGHGTNEPAGLC